LNTAARDIEKWDDKISLLQQIDMIRHCDGSSNW